MTATITTTGYILQAFPLTDEGTYTEGDVLPTEDAAYQEMREWMIEERWTYQADETGYYALDGARKVYAFLITRA